MKLMIGALNCGLLFQTAKERKVEMRIFALPVAIYFLNLTAIYTAFVLLVRGASWVGSYVQLFISFTDWPFPLGTYQVTGIAVQLALFTILLFRFVRTRSDEERYKTELEAARTVQQVLVPEEIPTLPGFASGQRLQTRRAGWRRLLSDHPDRRWRCAGGYRRRQRQGYACCHDRRTPGWNTAHPGTLHAKALRDFGRDEPAHAGAQFRRIHHLPGAHRERCGHAHSRQRRPPRALR